MCGVECVYVCGVCVWSTYVIVCVMVGVVECVFALCVIGVCMCVVECMCVWSVCVIVCDWGVCVCLRV